MARGFKTGLATGIAISVTAALMAPLWRPAVARWGRPALKGAMKQGAIAYEIVRERMAEAGESISDLAAEVQLERMNERLAEHAPSAMDRAAAD